MERKRAAPEASLVPAPTQHAQPSDDTTYHQVPCALEERFVPSSLFHVDTYGSTAARRLTYEPAAVDASLLIASDPFTFDDIAASSKPLDSNEGHPLVSLRAGAAEVQLDPRTRAALRSNAVRFSESRNLPDAHERPPPGATLLRVAFFEGRKKLREYEVLSTQPLDEMVGHLSCVTDEQLAFQVEECARRGIKDLQPPTDSAACCIEGLWYVHGPQDLSAGVREWDAARRGQAAAQPLPMEGSTFGSLSLRLGQPYLFVHHGDGEHAVVFTRCALATDADTLEPGAYPQLVWEAFGLTKSCSVCSRAVATWETHDDRLADTNPCFLCQMCHYQLHYTKEGDSIRRDYKVYPYHGSSHLSVRGRKAREQQLPRIENAGGAAGVSGDASSTTLVAAASNAQQRADEAAEGRYRGDDGTELIPDD